MWLVKLEYGRVDEVSYWVDISLGQGVFPKVDEVVKDQDSMGMGFMEYKGL